MDANKFKQIFISQYSINEQNRDFNNYKNLVLLEGKTDYDFFKKSDFKFIKFTSVSYVIHTYQKFKAGFDNELYNKNIDDDKPENNKELIRQLVSGYWFDNKLKKVIEDNNFFGIIDRDFDGEYNGTNSRLISNDTHDIETMILRGDNNLVLNISSMSNDVDMWAKAKYMAYQLAQIKLALKNSVKHNKYQKARLDDVDKYFDQTILNIKKYINYIVNCYKTEIKNKSLDNKNKKMSFDKSGIYSKLIKELNNQGKVDSNENLTIKYSKFINGEPKDFWQLVNGHDLLIFILYLNKNNGKFINLINRFENFIIENYNYDNFKNEPLYSKMKKFNLA